MPAVNGKIYNALHGQYLISLLSGLYLFNLYVMCGINGFITYAQRNNPQLLLDNMNTAIQHRGPDGRGRIVLSTEEKYTIGLGQVRLSIIDLTNAGFQPMFYDIKHGAFSEKHQEAILGTQQNDALGIVFNGEIYNYKEIKNELEGMGYFFSTHSDTEVILAAYQERGSSCVDHFNGMRSFVIYDPFKRNLFCSRDRLGEKPLYYYFTTDTFIFSSELKGIISFNPDVVDVDNIDLEAIDFYLSSGFIPAPRTIYKNINKLEAGCSMIIHINDSMSIDHMAYFHLPIFLPSYNKNKLIQEGKKILQDSVDIRVLSADVPVGSFLSGGLDSSAVVGAMTHDVHASNLNTFSIGFSGKYDESHYINIVKHAFSTNHHHLYFHKEDFLHYLDKMYFYYDEPFGDYSGLPTMSVSDLAKKYVTVSLSGDGGDEIFGGYLMHQVASKMTILRTLPKALRKLLYLILPNKKSIYGVIHKIKEACRLSLLPTNMFYAELHSKQYYIPSIYQKRTTEKLDQILKNTNGNFVQALIDFDLLYNTLGDNFLTKVDRASMSQALEVRCPFLDFRWIDRSRRVPTRWKVTGKKTKIIMREIIKDIIPEEILKRGKQGFTPPFLERIGDELSPTKIHEYVQILMNNNIISHERYTFYTNTVCVNDDVAFNIYKIRIFLFMKRYHTWIKK